MSTVTLSNGRYTIALSEYGSDPGLAKRLLRFLTPYFAEVDDVGAPALAIDLQLALHDAAAFEPRWVDSCETWLTIRDTDAPGFMLQVLTTWDGPFFLAWDPELRVGYRIDQNNRSVDFYGEQNAFIHLIELIRYYGLLVEQAKGSAVMHASAVVERQTGNVIAIGGVKGAGKTTTMLELVQSGDYLYFSGDKLLLDIVEGRLRARGWPDYPHIGIGTLRAHPRLAERLGFSALIADPAIGNKQKRLCRPEAMRAALEASPTGSGWLSTVILPNVAALGEPSSALLDADAIGHALLAPGLFEWPHRFITSTWHGLLDPAFGELTDTVSPALLKCLAELTWQSRTGVAVQSIAA
ncbi:MAG: ATP-binding protein [Janthinobacterium lividum]